MLADERKRRTGEIYSAALRQDASRRADFLREACGDDTALRRELESLLGYEERLDGFLEPAAEEARAGAGGQSLVGQALGPYAILSVLGAGGMGVVYEAEDRQRNVRVALKTLSYLDPQRLFLLKNEFRSLTGITHPNLVTLYELVSEGSEWFFTMELVAGVDFLDYVRAGTARRAAAGVSDEPESILITTPPIQLDRLRNALRQLVEGVSALHDHGKLHRDIKPSNVLVTPDGRTVLLDFGLAIALTFRPDNEAPPTPMGTLPYMAPEQITGAHLTEAADWYAVGVMLYEALTGRLPFEGGRSEIMQHKLTLEPVPAQVVAPGIPADLAGLCDGLLRRDPAQRRSGEQVRQCLGLGPRALAPAAGRLFVGREQELRELRAGLADLQAGRPATTYVHGQSGIGKTHLVERFLDECAALPDLVLLRGRCYEQESVPYKALDSVVDSLSTYLGGLPGAECAALLPGDAHILAQIFPVLRSIEVEAAAFGREPEIPDPQELRRRAAAALRELLTRIGDCRRLVIYIDDLQWGDLDSGLLLNELLHPPNAPTLLLIGSYRTEYAASSPCLQTLLQGALGGAARQIALRPLDGPEAHQLAARLLGPAGAADAGRIVAETGGNPYFVRELAESARAGTEWSSGEGPLSLDDVLGHRVQGLPAHARIFLEAVAVSGQPLAQEDAYRAAGLPVRDPAVLASLRSGRLVRTTGPHMADFVETYHDRIRETVVARMPPDDVRRCHLRLAVTLETSSGVERETLAIHFHRGGEPGKAGAYYILAGDQAATALAFERASTLYAQALDLPHAADPGRRELRVKLADALANAGRGLDAASQYEAARVGANNHEALDLKRRAAYQYCISGHMEQGRAAVRHVLKRIGMWLPHSETQAIAAWVGSRALLRLRGMRFRERAAESVSPALLRRIDVSWSAAAGLTMVDVITGADIQTRNLILALRAGEPYRIARALALEAIHSANMGSRASPRTRSLLAAAHQLAEGIGHPHARALVSLAQAIAHFEIGEWTPARRFLIETEKILRAQCTGVFWELATTHAFTLWNFIDLGEYGELARRSSELLREARDRGDRFTATNIGIFIGPHALLAADRPDEARRMTDEYLAQWTRQESSLQSIMALMCHNYIDVYVGDGRRASQRLRKQWPQLQRSRLMHSQLMRIFMYYARGRSALAACAGAEDTRAMLASAVADADRLGIEAAAWARPHAELLRAGVARKRGDEEGAAGLLRSALGHFEEVEMGSFAASARRMLGRLLGGDAGTEMVRNADSWMQRQGIANPAAMAAFHVAGFEE